jgi:hypothetical protein
MHNIQEEKDYSKPINSLKDKLMQLKKDVSTVSKAHAKTEKAVQKTVDDKDQALTPEDHQAAMSHFRGLYQNAKRNKDDSGANEAARQYHDYANKLSDIYQRKLKEETMNPYLQEDMQLDENLAVHGKYTIKSGPAISGMGEGSPDHVTAHKGRLKAIGVKADRSEQDGRYGTTHRVTVKNNETGQSTYHHVYQSGTHGTKPTMSVRTVGAARKNQEEHHSALKDYLSGKKPTTKYSGLASESVNQPVAGSLKPGRTLHPGWMLAADPKLRAAVNTAKAKQKEFKRLVGTKTNEEYDLTEETIDTSKDRQGKIKVGSKVRSYDFPGYHNDHYIEGHVHQETPHSYHIQVSKVVRAGKEMPIPAHMHHVEAPKGKGHFSNHYAVHPLKEGFVAEVSDATLTSYLTKLDKDNLKHRMDPTKRSDAKRMKSGPNFVKAFTKLDNRKQGVAEGEEHLARIRKLSGLEEATKLPAQSREFGGQEFQDYMNRIAGTPDVDKAGNVKTDKKGNEKYVSGKTKSDRYKMPYIHRSSVITYLSPDGKTYDEEAVKKTLAIRPKALLKQNEKMKHSNGEFEQFFNVGFAALTGIALDEQTNNLIIVNTCPGAGSCKVDCFAMKGGKVQFQGPWQSDGRILTYLLNDPDGFFNQLSAEITKESVAGKKGDKKFPNGWETTIRWHDAGDFFSPEYLDMALKMAAKHPDVKFYAYTKMAGAALAQKPPNFIINWSEGAHTSQEKQVKASDANLDTTKNSRIVPDEIFQDLLVKDEKKNLVKGEQGQWQVQPDKLPELKQRLAKEYGLSANSILDYNEYMAKRKSIPAGMKYNVIVAPGEGDISANDPNIISTLLLKH